jgi:hypothetical protein
VIGVALAGCATSPPPSPDASACLDQAPPAKRSSDFQTRLASLKLRAAMFAACMEERGYGLDEVAVQDELLRIEQVRNADQRAGDPQMELWLREQELRADPRYWRKAPAAG